MNTKNELDEFMGENESGAQIELPEKEVTEKGSVGTYVHKFKKSFEYAGKKYSSLNFYFNNLTGRDMILIENEMMANNEFALDPLLSKSFQCKLASRAGSIGSDVIEGMPLSDFTKITGAARNFLMSDSGG
jgi:hypothetical protein